MRILQIGTLDTKGGAAIVSWELSNELRKRGHIVDMFVGYKYSNDPKVHVVPRTRYQNRLMQIFANDLIFSHSDRILESEEFKKADIIHCHNLHSGFFNLSTLEKMSRLKPIVWTMHDLWAITSGCSDSYTCRLNKPQKMFGIFDTRAHILKTKGKIYKNSDFLVVSPSRWLDSNIGQSILKEKQRIIIHNGIDTSVFKPATNKESLRKVLHLPLDKKNVMFAANRGMKNRLKGSKYIDDLVKRYAQDERVIFLSVGNDEKGSNDNKNMITTGYLPKEKLAEYYSASDVFLYPSLADNCPLVVLESMACGIPVITFETDGIPEIVSGCGYISKYESVDDLINNLEKFLDLSAQEYEKMSSNCARKIQTEYSLEKMTSEYLNAYSQAIEKFRSSETR